MLNLLLLIPIIYLFGITSLAFMVKFVWRKQEKLSFKKSFKIAFKGYNTVFKMTLGISKG